MWRIGTNSILKKLKGEGRGPCLVVYSFTGRKHYLHCLHESMVTGSFFISPSLDRKLHRFIYQIGSWDGSYYRYTRCSLGLRKFNVGINVFIFEKPIASPNGNCDGGGKWQNDFFPFSLRDPLSMQTPPPRDIYVKFVSN